MRLRLLLLIAGLFLVAAAPRAPTRVATVEVVRNGDVWTAQYAFARKAPAWLFLHSALSEREGKPWRPGSWNVLTPGVKIVRRGPYDLLVAEKGNVPAAVTIRFTPAAVDLRSSYRPALRFTTGAVALFSDQFDVTPLRSVSAADALPADQDEIRAPGPTRVTFRDTSGPVLHRGKREPIATTEDGETYILFGSARIVDTPDIATIIDPALPAWLASELASMTPRLLAYHAERLGPRPGPKPMFMATWNGPIRGRTSMNGGTLPGLVIMAFEGERLTAASPEALNHVRWFIAHETAHFWLGQAVGYDSAAHAWTTEGGADLLAVRAIAAADRNYDPKVRLNAAIATCERLARGKALDLAAQRGDQGAYYGCGAVFSLAAEAAANKARPGSGLTGFWRRLIEENRKDRIVSDEDWLSLLTRLAGDSSAAATIRRFQRKGSDDPRRDIASLLERAGVPFETGAAGQLRLK